MGCHAPVAVDDICRVCMCSDRDFTNIFDAAVVPSLAEILTQCTQYAPKRTDALPKKICAACKSTAQMAYSFKRECERSYRQLTMLLTGKSAVLHVGKCVDCGTQTDVCNSKAKVSNDSSKQNQKHCPICQRKFSHREHMRRHLAVMHKLVEPLETAPLKVRGQEPKRMHLDLTTDKTDLIYGAEDTELMPVRTPFDMLELFGATSDSKDEEDDEQPLAELTGHTSLTNSNVFVQVLLNETKVENNDVIGLDETTLTTDELKLTPDDYIETLDLAAGSTQVASNLKLRNKRRRGRPPCIKTVGKQNSIYEKNTTSKTTQSGAGSFSPVNTDDATISSRTDSTACEQVHAAKTQQCNICQKWFTTRLYLMRHLTIHERKRYVCKECSQSFLTKDELAAHVKTEGHDKPMLCPECGLRCKTSNILMVHMRRHNGEKPYKCKFCSKGFPRVDDLRVHEKYHTGEKSHFCETCGKGFQRKYNLTIHLRVHTGERPYKCPHCPQAFAQGNDLKAHIRRHTGERFRCELCDAAFLQIYQIRQHKLTQHGIKEEPPTQRVAKFTSPEAQEQQIKRNLQQELPTCAIYS